MSYITVEIGGVKKRFKRQNKARRVLGTIGTVVIAIVAVIAVWWFHTVKWGKQQWTDLTIDEMMYTLSMPMEGVGSDMIKEFITKACVPAIIFAGIVIVVLILIRRTNIFKAFVKICLVMFATVLLFLSTYDFSTTLDISSYVENRASYGSFIDDNYVDPSMVRIAFPEQKRNLVYIFLESTEMTFTDEEHGGAFGVSVIPDLTDLALENECFNGTEEGRLDGAISLYNTTWTMAGMFAQSVALPLTITIGSQDMDTQTSFFPGIIGTGDILEQAGYKNYLCIGSNATFGGRRLFYTDHGDYTMWDYNWSVENGQVPEGYYINSGWGYEDKLLFEHAKEHLLELAEKDEPFNFTMLTMDTHFEDGYYCEDCVDTYGEVYADVYGCSDKKVTEFVRWIQQQDFYENTTIILCGDHPTMDKDFCLDVDKDYQRKTYTCVINSAVEPELDEYRTYSTFDLFPTTLAALGFEIQGNRLGLGTNLFSSEPTLTEQIGVARENEQLAQKSELMDKLQGSINQNTAALVQREKSREDIKGGAGIKASISLTQYDWQTGSLYVYADVSEAPDIEMLRCAVWKNEDQSDLTWYEMVRQDDGIYAARVYAGDFGFRSGSYQCHIYAIRTDSSVVMLSSLMIGLLK